MRQIWTVWGLDVWGNEEDGFEVNDRYRIGTVSIDASWSNAEIVKALIRQGALKRTVKGSDVQIDGDDMYMAVDDAETGEPVLGLEAE